jgi:uncharacterized coiled-coil protein SlyX
MEFYQGTAKLGETTGSSPYTFTWSNVPAGTYSITAKAIDAGGLSFTSAAINISVPASSGWSLSGNAGTTPGNHFIGTTDNQRLVFKAGNTEYMTILPGGNVGIGTPNPTNTFWIKPADGQGITLEGATGSVSPGLSFYDGAQTQKGVIGMALKDGSWSNSAVAGDYVIRNNNGNIIFSTTDPGYETQMVLKSNGNVGIGTNDPQARLAVNGDIFTKKIRITPNGWPDYVFEKDYRLPPLQETEQFIHQHHHLPGIQPAATVEKEGLDVGDHQTAILKKMEELTLYLIEQHKKIQQLTDQLVKQQATIEMQNDRIKKLSGTLHSHLENAGPHIPAGHDPSAGTIALPAPVFLFLVRGPLIGAL